ncbi:MAG: ABC transporter ATP-binding protein [Pedobacter sp.]|nr:MAG: ABC transporter ATP-binding protein [Pedobacter sp.]
MSTLIAGENLGHSYHDSWLFKNLTVGINKGQRVALVGVNGAGKSTFLKILSEKVKPLEGKVVKNKATRIGFLEQDPHFPGNLTISEYLFSAENKQQQLIKEYEEALSSPVPDEAKIAELATLISNENAWEYEHQIKSILGRMGIVNFNQKIESLSGGQKKRLALAKLLIEDPEIYILDEPTNHLDIETIEWLEKLLTTGAKTILLVTHDRYFLDNVCNAIIELDGGKSFYYQGNYANFLEKKAAREEQDDIQYQKNKGLLKKELEWMRRMPAARTTKSKSRIDAFYDLSEKTKQRTDNQEITLSTKVSRMGNKILEIENLSKSFNQINIVDNFSYIFKKGDRIGLAGKNGTGKTTFLNLITGKLNPDKGRIEVGETTVFGYYVQTGLNFNEKEKVIDIIKAKAEYIEMANGEKLSASALLTLFLFPPKKQFGLIEKLSGGEKKRLQLLLILMQNPNFLILDEPTNDLDIDTLNVLESFIENYPGVLVLVSHDRFLLDKMTDQLFILEGNGQVKIFNGNYSDYKLEEDKIQVATSTKESPTPKLEPKVSKKLSYKEQREFDDLEATIAKQEDEIENLNKKFLEIDSSDYLSIKENTDQIEKLKFELDNNMMRWLELSEKIS